jgi:hypothetical protein
MADDEGPGLKEVEDRRQGDRRTGDRRARGAHGKVCYAAWGFAAGVIPAIALLLMIQIDEPVTRRSNPWGSVNMETDEYSEFPPRNPGIGTTPPKPKKSEATTLTDDLLAIAPNLYNAVLLRGQNSEQTVPGTEGLSNLSLVDVKNIEISVKAKTWDGISGDEKVAVLKRTWDFLSARYPSLTQVVELSFDDGRPNLDLRF